jgi:hypothetical protein
MNLVELPQLPILPLLAVDLGIQEVDPLLPALSFGSVKAPAAKLLSNPLPAFGGKLGV